MTDPLFGTPGWNALTGMRPRRDEDSAYEFVCCCAPVEGHHEAACPQSPIWAQMVTEQGDPFHIWAFVPWGAADFMHDDYVQRWYWYHGFGSYPQRFLLGFESGKDGLDLRLFQQKTADIQVSEGSWTLPDYEFGLVPGRDVFLGDRFPPETPSFWQLESARQQRMAPISETLKDLLNDENLKITVHNPAYDPYPEPKSKAQRLANSLSRTERILKKIGVEMVDDPPKALAAAPEPQKRVYQHRKDQFSYEVQDEHDGTWSVSMVWPSGRYGNPQFFPNEREAHWFAREMAGGALVAGAMMKVHEKRIDEARMGQRFRDRYAWGAR